METTDRAPGIVNCAAYQDGVKVGHVEIDDVSEVLKVEGQFVWIGLHEPDAQLLRKVQEEFKLHDLAVEDALRAHQRPKLDEYDDNLFIVVRTVQLNGDQMEFGETHFFVGPQYLVSIRHANSLAYVHVRQRCESAPALLKKGPGFVLYALMDFIVDHYFPVVEAIEEHVESLEENVFAGQFERGTTVRIYELKRDLLKLKRAVAPLVDVCTRLERFDLALIPAEVRPYFRDVHDHLVRVNERLENMREMLTSVLEANLSLMSVNQNEVTKRLAAWAAILAVPTMMAGIWGMNFEYMPELHSPYGYPIVVAMMVATCGVLYWQFRRAGWL